MTWNTVLQMNHPIGSDTNNVCLKDTVPGLGRPIHIHLLSCQPSVELRTVAIFNSIKTQLNLPAGTIPCGGPGAQGRWQDGIQKRNGSHCMAWNESSCQHILVLMTDGAPLNNHAEQFALDWKQRAGINGTIIPILPPHAGGASLPKSLQSMNRLTDVGSAASLAADILRWVQVGAERKLFLSYRRDDTKNLADQIHHALVQRGYRVYLDRFSGTPGRFFPQEIAEELADKGCVLLLESQNLAKSRWTRWEIAFARHYHLGLMALNVDGASPLPAGPQSPDRMNVSTQSSSGKLSASDLEAAIDFIVQRYSINSIARRVFYEELLRKISQSEGVGFQELGGGTYALSAHGKTALVYPSGRPGNLSELHYTALTSSFPGTLNFRILAGQHQHLPPRANQELNWLAQLAVVMLRRPYQLPGSIHDFANGGNP
jgi:hypothetical protein